MSDSPRNRLLEPVPWSIFLWAAGIVVVMIGGLFVQHATIGQDLANEKDARISGDASQLQLSNDLKTQYAQIQAELLAIKETQLELKQDIRNSK